ncbi:hypothetical protein SUGI_0596910 [Cryptomeria japonica]|uniref:U-box domain-containing protein 26 n=1 Tax=Cryptomeria japonica TaxID=3369 RepID=UPI0024147DCE|nr:U-box domain-containing protein 26 [Cryptomeria japonica]GLJ30177.1 hypothetical protein SUGI_0596910 [Cryptomeria japonica]
MKNRGGNHVRLHRHMMSCGMFGSCAATILSPKAAQDDGEAAAMEEPETATATTRIESFTRWELPVARERAATWPKQRSEAVIRGDGAASPSCAATSSGGAAGDEAGLISGLVAAVRECRRGALKPLLALCLAEPRNRGEAVRAGGVAALLEALPNLKDVAAAERALATLDLLSTVCEGRIALREHSLVVPLLLEMIFKVSDRGTEYAVSCLCAACESALNPQETALQYGALTQLLLLLQSECSARAKRKGLHLLKLLHKLWEQSPENGDKSIIFSNVADEIRQ